MALFTVPTRDEVSANDQAIFDKLSGMIGFVPNLYAYFAKNETALADYLALQNRKTTLRPLEREIINLVVSEVNDCRYCLAAHTTLGKKLHGLAHDEILAIRRAEITSDPKLAALATFVKETVANRGNPSAEATNAFLEAGYTEANLIDVVIVIGDKIISNYLHGITQLPIDWESAPEIERAASA